MCVVGPQTFGLTSSDPFARGLSLRDLRHRVASPTRLPALTTALVVTLCTPLAAAAQQVCATSADLAEGIVVTYANGGIDTLRSDPANPGTVIWQGEYQGQSLGTTVFAQGYIFLSAVGPFGEVRYDYGILPADLPRPTPGGNWEAVATVSSAEGASTERQIHSYGGAASLSLGDCRYAMIPVTIDYPANREDLFWFSDLGISVRAGDVVTQILPLRLMP